MTAVAWRQHRAQMMWAAAGLAALAAFLVPTGLGMAHSFTSSGLARCLSTIGSDCGDLSSAFDGRYSSYSFLIPLFMAAPVLFGIFFGAPMIAREIENGTHRLAWTQGVTRSRWLSTKLVMIEGSACAGAALLAYIVTWWSRPLVTNSSSRFHPGIFDLRGVVPIAYTVFAVMLAIAIGSMIKKTLATIGLTLVGYTGTRVLIELAVRPRYLKAKRIAQSFLFKSGPFSERGRGIWVLSENTIDRAGHIVSRGGGFDFGYLAARCPAVAAQGPFPQKAVGPGGKDVIVGCVRHLGLRVSTVYQPAGRFWTFQWIEFGIFMALAAALAVFAFWRTKRLS